MSDTETIGIIVAVVIGFLILAALILLKDKDGFSIGANLLKGKFNASGENKPKAHSTEVDMTKAKFGDRNNFEAGPNTKVNAPGMSAGNDSNFRFGTRNPEGPENPAAKPDNPESKKS